MAEDDALRLMLNTALPPHLKPKRKKKAAKKKPKPSR
jgi:hypothetical protein